MCLLFFYIYSLYLIIIDWNFLIMYGLAFLPGIVYAILLVVQAFYVLDTYVSFICEFVTFLLGLSPPYTFFIFLVNLALQGSGYSISSRLTWNR